MNYMKQVADILGVEFGEGFVINGSEDATFHITEAGLFRVDAREIRDILLRRLLTGEVQITEKPWKPKQGQPYHFVSFEVGVLWDYFGVENFSDKLRYKIGNCFRTKEEITPEIIEKYKKFYESDEVLEI